MKKYLVCMPFLLLAALTARAERFPGPHWVERPDPYASPYAEVGGTLVYAGTSAPQSFNAYMDNNTFSHMIFGMMYLTLLGTDSVTDELAPSLAREWEVSEDKLTFTFFIDERAKWSDGTPVTAHDVKATIDAIKNVYCPNAFQVLLHNIESPVIIDDRTLSFKCKEVHWQNLLTLGGVYILPKKLIDDSMALVARELPKTILANYRKEAAEAYKKQFEEGEAAPKQPLTEEDIYQKKLLAQAFKSINFEFPIVGGPYRIGEHKEGRYIVLERRADWWIFDTPSGKGLYNFEKIRIPFFLDRNNAFESFKKGDIDVIAIYSARQWAIDSMGKDFDKNWIVKQNIHNLNPCGFQGLVMNMRKKPYDDIRVRKAIAHLYDKRRMVNDLMFGAYDLHRSFFEDIYDDPAYINDKPALLDYDPHKAFELLTEAGFRINKETGKMEYPVEDPVTKQVTMKPFVVNILTNDKGAETYLAVFNNSLARLGITMAIKRVDFGEWMNIAGNYDFETTMCAFAGGLQRDPEPMWHSRHMSRKQGVNRAGYSNPEVDALIDSQKAEFSLAKRNKILREIDKKVCADVPYALAWYIRSTRMLYWNKFGTPDNVLGKRGDELSIPAYWWYDKDSARELEYAMKHDLPVAGREAESHYREPPAVTQIKAENAAREAEAQAKRNATHAPTTPVTK